MINLRDWVLERPYLALTIICLFLHLPGFFSLPPMDRDEARFAQATKQMIETGDYVSIRFQDTDRNKKPIGVYWAQAPFAALFSGVENTRIWAYRIPSLLAAIGATLLTFWLGQTLFDRDRGFIAALILGSSVLLVVEANLAKSDASLLAATLAAQAVLAIAYVKRERPMELALAMVFWFALAAGVLLKGPVTPLVLALTALTLIAIDRNAGWLLRLKPALGLPLFVLVTAPWFIAIAFATEGAFFAEALGGDLAPKLFSGHESHGAPPGFHTLLAFPLLWPGSLLLAPALIGAWSLRRTPEIKFCLAWVIPMWLLFELLPTKLPHYVLPLYPALALLAAVGAAQILETGWAKQHALFILSAKTAWFSIGLLLGGGALVLQVYLAGGANPAAITLTAAATVLIIAAFVFSLRNDWTHAIVVGGVGVFFLYGLAFEATLARLKGFHMSQEAAALIEQSTAADKGLISIGYSEPSLVFLTSTDTLLTTAENGAAMLADPRYGAVLVEARVMDVFLEHAKSLGRRVTMIGSTAGLNYSNGRPVNLTLFEIVRVTEPVVTDP